MVKDESWALLCGLAVHLDSGGGRSEYRVCSNIDYGRGIYCGGDVHGYVSGFNYCSYVRVRGGEVIA